MTVRWAPEAADDFAPIVEYLESQNAAAAERAARRIFEGIATLESFPRSGRSGRVLNTRELVLTPLPFVVIYRIKHNAVEIARILHTSQRWP